MLIIHHVFFSTGQKVLECTKDTKAVTIEDRVPNKKEQLWVKGSSNEEGYFTLKSSEECSKVPKFMTAISASNLEIKGNHLLIIKCCLPIYYHIIFLLTDLKDKEYQLFHIHNYENRFIRRSMHTPLFRITPWQKWS